MTNTEDIKELRGAQKAAAALIMLGPDVAAKIMKKLTDVQVEQLSREISMLGSVPEEMGMAVMQEYAQRFNDCKSTSYGGIDFTREVLEKAVGQEKASQIIGRLEGYSSTPFEFIRKTDPGQLLNFIQYEHPQTIALVLAHMEPNQSAIMLSALAPELQSDVVKRIATMDKTTPDVVKEVEEVLERRMSSVSNAGLTVTGGVKAVAEVLNRADRSTEKTILQVMEKDNPEIAEEIKKLMFVFEDILLVDDRGIQQGLKEIESKELALALKTASDDLKEKIFKNMSKRAAEAVKEEMSFMGPVRLRQVEEAQQKIVAVIRRLEEAGQVVIAGRGGKEDAIVG